MPRVYLFIATGKLPSAWAMSCFKAEVAVWPACTSFATLTHMHRKLEQTAQEAKLEVAFWRVPSDRGACGRKPWPSLPPVPSTKLSRRQMFTSCHDSRPKCWRAWWDDIWRSPWSHVPGEPVPRNPHLQLSQHRSFRRTCCSETPGGDDWPGSAFVAKGQRQLRSTERAGGLQFEHTYLPLSLCSSGLWPFSISQRLSRLTLFLALLTCEQQVLVKARWASAC